MKLLVLGWGECRGTQGSKQCLIVELTFKSSQGSRAAALKNNQFPSLLMTPLTLDHYRRGALRQPSVHDRRRGGADGEEKQSGFAQHERWEHVWKQTQSCLSEERTKALTQYKHAPTKHDHERQGELKSPPK